jgi:hypothetical protein
MKATAIRKAVGEARTEVRSVRRSIEVLVGPEALVIALRRTPSAPAPIHVIAPSGAGGKLEGSIRPQFALAAEAWLR